jgi:hypothetical protein
MGNDPKVTIRFYSGFLDDGWYTLAKPVQDALVSFLERLQSNPENPASLGNVEIDKKGRLGLRFAEGYAVYWRIFRKQPAGLGLSDPITIDVLEVVRTKQP